LNLSDALQALLAVCSILALVVVGNSNIKKQVISDLQALVMAHEQTINKLKEENTNLRKDSAAKDERICALEETVDGYSELVRKGYLLGGGWPRGRNRSTPSETA
jgi:hypothetical protein